MDVPERFQQGYAAVAALEAQSRYIAALIFGSVPEGTSDEQSDLDVMVVVDEDNDCTNINHPTIDDYKLDISFRSFSQLKAYIDKQVEGGEREPNLVRAQIVFDKTGELTQYQADMRKLKPPQHGEADYQLFQFQLYHATNKVERFLESDPAAALYSMHANIGEVLKVHFKLQQRWWVSSKRVLHELDDWDPALSQVVKDFVGTADMPVKYRHWLAIIDHVARPMGGRQPIAENNCDCTTCQTDLAQLGGS